MSDLISRQAAIEAITDELDRIDHVPQWVFDRLEGRLKQLPPAQLGTNLAEVGADCISRQAAIDALKAQADTMRTWVERYAEQRRGILTAINIVEDIKPADVVPVRHGHWTLVGWHKGMKIMECSCCKKRAIGATDFCPNCGAKMDGGDEHE